MKPAITRFRLRGDHDPAAPGATVGRGIGVASGGAEGPLERAVVRFNESEASRVVAGLSRTLGAPRVSVGAAAGSPSEVRITVAWDLCWYQWAVDAEAPSRAVSEIARGTELAQLDGSARQWNAKAAGEGRLALGPIAGLARDAGSTL